MRNGNSICCKLYSWFFLGLACQDVGTNPLKTLNISVTKIAETHIKSPKKPSLSLITRKFNVKSWSKINQGTIKGSWKSKYHPKKSLFSLCDSTDQKPNIIWPFHYLYLLWNLTMGKIPNLISQQWAKSQNHRSLRFWRKKFPISFRSWSLLQWLLILSTAIPKSFW